MGEDAELLGECGVSAGTSLLLLVPEADPESEPVVIQFGPEPPYSSASGYSFDLRALKKLKVHAIFAQGDTEVEIWTRIRDTSIQYNQEHRIDWVSRAQSTLESREIAKRIPFQEPA